MKTAAGVPIVAFRASSAIPHYASGKKSKVIENGTIITLDIWARLNKKGAPFADITWMTFYGDKIPKKVQEIFDIVIGARDEGIKYLRSQLKNKRMPQGREVDNVVREYIEKFGHGEKFIHSTGHELGLTSPHGRRGGLRKKAKGILHQNLGYTIEPGIYLPNEFGVRSEIDFYVTSQYKLVITSRVQKKLIEI